MVVQVVQRRKVVSWIMGHRHIASQPSKPARSILFICSENKEGENKEGENKEEEKHGWSKQRKLQQASSKQQTANGSRQQSSFDGMDGMESSLDGNNKKQQQDGSGSQVDMRKYHDMRK